MGKDKKYVVISLFNGLGCIWIALERAGIKVSQKISSEVDKHAIKANDHNYPETIQIGDVRKINVIKDENGRPIKLETENGIIDLLDDEIILGGGSPCTQFSFAGKMKGMTTRDEQEVLTLEHYMKLKEQEYEFEGQSYLFWEYMRLKNELNPKYFLLENVIMVEKWRKVLSRSIGVNPIRINSSLLTAQNRDRYYWTDIYSEPAGLFGDMECKIPQPKDKGILLKHILQKDVAEKYYLKNPKFGFNGMDINAKGNTLRTGGKASQTDKHNYDIIKIDVDGNPKANQDKASCFTAGGHSGGNHSDMDLLMYQLPHGTNPGGEVAKDGKTPSMTTSSWEHNNLLVEKEAECVAMRVRNPDNPNDRTTGAPTEQRLEPRVDGKTNCLTSVSKDNLIREKEVKQINPSTESGGKQPYQQNRIYDTDGISPALCADKSDLLIQGCDYRTDEGLRVRDNGKTGTLATRARNDESCGQLAKINSRIRRLTPVECCRLQNIPDNYFYDKDGKNVISDSQIYRCVGNGWSCDVVAHIFSFI